MESEKICTKISKNMSNQKFVNDLQIDQNIKDSIAVDLKKKRSVWTPKYFFLRHLQRKKLH